MNDEHRQDGESIRRQLRGDDAVAHDKTYTNDTMAKFIEVAEELIYGRLWTRPGLGMKTRTLICVVSSVATGSIGILPVHISMALRQGWTRDEITEVLLQLIGYVGAPRVREAMLCASKVFAEEKTSAQT